MTQVDDGRSEDEIYRILEEIFIRLVAETACLVDGETKVVTTGGSHDD